MNDRFRVVLARLKHTWEVRKERRQIMALAAAGVFLLLSFWNSFQNNRLKSDLTSAHVKETIQSGRIHVPHADADFSAVVVVEIDEQGQLKNILGGSGWTPEKRGTLDKLVLTPMRINNIARSAKVPLTIPLETDTQSSSQEPFGGKDVSFLVTGEQK